MKKQNKIKEQKKKKDEKFKKISQIENADKGKKFLSDSCINDIIENAFDGLIVFNQSGKIVYANQPLLETTGYQMEELINHYLISFLHGDELRQGLNLWAENKNVPSTQYQIKVKCKNGVLKSFSCCFCVLGMFALITHVLEAGLSQGTRIFK